MNWQTTSTHNYMREQQPTRWQLLKALLKNWLSNYLLALILAFPLGLALAIIWKLFMLGFNLI